LNNFKLESIRVNISNNKILIEKEEKDVIILNASKSQIIAVTETNNNTNNTNKFEESDFNFTTNIMESDLSSKLIPLVNNNNKNYNYNVINKIILKKLPNEKYTLYHNKN